MYVARANIVNNKMEKEIIPLFPIPFYRNNIGRKFTEDESQFLFSDDIPMTKKEKIGMEKHISKDLYLFDNFEKELKDIKDFCEQQLKHYLEDVDGVNTDLATLRITQSWLNKSKPGESHNRHFHSNSYISGVFYISCLPNDHIVLDNRSFGLYNNMIFPVKETTVWNAQGSAEPVDEGDLILFPSWIPHHVNLNETKNQTRISLAFNTFPIGEMGKYAGGQLIL